MKMRTTHFSKLASVIFLPLAIATNVYANESSRHEDEHEHSHQKIKEHIQHESHEHGVARLAIAKTNSGMEITLETPAANLLGFEHKPNSKEDHEVVHSATEKLNTGEMLFLPNKSANCQLEDIDIESDLISRYAKEKHNKHDHDRHKHDEHKAEHEKHDDHSSHEQNKKVAHHDVDITWVFKCEKASSLESVEAKLFSQFPNGFENINVEWITNDAAGTIKLKTDGIVKLSP